MGHLIMCPARPLLFHLCVTPWLPAAAITPTSGRRCCRQTHLQLLRRQGLTTRRRWRKQVGGHCAPPSRTSLCTPRWHARTLFSFTSEYAHRQHLTAIRNLLASQPGYRRPALPRHGAGPGRRPCPTARVPGVLNSHGGILVDHVLCLPRRALAGQGVLNSPALPFVHHAGFPRP